MKRSSAVFLVLVILVLGFLVGVLATHLFYAQKLGRAGSFSMMASEFFAERLERNLELTPAQREEIGTILEETREAAETLRTDVRPKVGRLMEETAERISEVLTDEQRQRFTELRERHRSRSEHFFLGPPGRRGRPPWHGHGRRGGSPGERPQEPVSEPGETGDTRPDEAEGGG